MTRVAIKFGIFVLVCLTFTGYLAFTIGNLDVRDPLGRDNITVQAVFDDVNGLLVNDNVKVAGVVVGKVTGITTERGRAVVTFQIRNKHADLPQDTAAAIRWRNLIGQRYLYLYPGTSPVTLRSGHTITDTASVIDLGEVFNRLGPIVGAIDPAQVNELLASITEALDGREDKVGEVLDDLAVLVTGLASRDDAIQRLITNLDTVAATVNRRDAQIEIMLENLVVLSETLADNTAILDEAFVELAAFGSELDTLLTNRSAEIDRILGHLAQVTDTVRSKLPELDEFLAGFADASAAVFRAGNRGEFLNQKILCAFVGPPTTGDGSCPTGDPVVGLSATTATPIDPAASSPPAVGADAISSLLRKVVGR